MKTVFFAGPSISGRKIRSILDADIAPPIRRGDLDRFGDYDVLVIIDGEFGQSLSVSPKEILAFLDRGKVVIGASSMGALRASELDVYGMVGVGWVYQRFTNVEIRRDDDVAMAFSPLDFSPVTVPMVDVEYWMESLRLKDQVSAKESAAILRTVRRIFFAERTEARIMLVLERAFGFGRLQHLLTATAGRLPDIKALDAEEAVLLAGTLGRNAGVGPITVPSPAIGRNRMATTAR
jgi:TfuA protein